MVVNYTNMVFGTVIECCLLRHPDLGSIIIREVVITNSVMCATADDAPLTKVLVSLLLTLTAREKESIKLVSANNLCSESLFVCC